MPEYDDDGKLIFTAEELKRIVRYQRWLIVILLLQLSMWGGCVVCVPVFGLDLGDAINFPLVLTVLSGMVAAIFAFLLYWVVRNPFSAMLVAAACCVPLLGLLVMLVVNSNVASVLKRHGVKVGYLGGASESDVQDDLAPWYQEDDAGW
jgi:hypothetical protein